MHRYKLSPRGKLYLKTDAEGKRKTEFDVEKKHALQCCKLHKHFSH